MFTGNIVLVPASRLVLFGSFLEKVKTVRPITESRLHEFVKGNRK